MPVRVQSNCAMESECARTVHDEQNEERVRLQASNCILRYRLIPLASHVRVSYYRKTAQHGWHDEHPSNPLLVKREVTQAVQVEHLGQQPSKRLQRLEHPLDQAWVRYVQHEPCEEGSNRTRHTVRKDQKGTRDDRTGSPADACRMTAGFVMTG